MIISRSIQCLPTVKVSLCPLSTADQDMVVIKAEVPGSVSLGHCECQYFPPFPDCDTQLIILNPEGGLCLPFAPRCPGGITTPLLPVCSWYQGVTGLTGYLGDAPECPFACSEAVNYPAHQEKMGW